MALIDRVAKVLDDAGISRADKGSQGYRVEPARDAVIVRWGQGEPFHGSLIKGGSSLARCAEALHRDGLHVRPKEDVGTDGVFFAVSDRP